MVLYTVFHRKIEYVVYYSSQLFLFVHSVVGCTGMFFARVISLSNNKIAWFLLKGFRPK